MDLHVGDVQIAPHLITHRRGPLRGHRGTDVTDHGLHPMPLPWRTLSYIARWLTAAGDATDALSAYEREHIPRTTRTVLRSAKTSGGGRGRVESRHADKPDSFDDWWYGWVSAKP